MADKTIANPETYHLTHNLVGLMVVVVAIVAFAGGWFAGQRHTKASINAKPVSSLLTYKNAREGFQLQYPASWGTPSFSKNDNSGGSTYLLSFAKTSSGDNKYTIILTMQSGQTALNTDKVKTILKEKKSDVVASDTTSYANVASSSQFKISSLSSAQIVNLPKISVTAAELTYSINSQNTNCPQNKFATGASSACIERADYDTVNDVLKSLKAL